MNLQTTWRRQRAKDRDTVERYADQIMVDTKWDWLRGPRRRRAIVVSLVVALIATAVLYMTMGSWGFVSLGVSIMLWIALRLAVRTVPDLPDEHLDERQIMLRDGAYRSAFVALSALLVVALSGMLVWVIVNTRDGSTTQLAIDDNDVFGVFWATIGFCMSLPSMALAWSDDAF